MAIGIVSGGVVFGDLGNSSTTRTTAARAAPLMWSRMPHRRHASEGRAYPDAQMGITRQLVDRSDRPPYSLFRTCDEPGAPPCIKGQPATALSGFSDVSNFICPEWAAVMTQLQGLLVTAEQQGLTSSVQYMAARYYFDDHSGPFKKPILACSSNTEAVKRFYLDLNALLGTGPRLDAIINPNAPGANMGSIVKWGAVAAVAVAGAYALGPLFRGIGGMLTKKGGK